MSGPRVGVCGLGLVGGSLLLALRDAGVDVRGCDVWPDPRTWCAEQDVPVDGSPEATARAVDVLVVCVPPGVTAPVVGAALAADPDVVVLDAASVKAPVARDVLARSGADAAARFLPAHPLAGAEASGHAGARAEILTDATWAVCPPATDPDGTGDDPRALLAAAPVLDAVGARLVPCRATDHDLAVAATSHAPHLAAGAAGRVAAGARAGGPRALALSGGALRDATRVAGAAPGLWAEILLANAGPTADALEAQADLLREAAATLRAGDADALTAAWETGRAAQRAVARVRWAEPAWEPATLAASWPALLEAGDAGTRLRALRPAADGRLAAERTADASDPATR